jgi:putative hemolysin
MEDGNPRSGIVIIVLLILLNAILTCAKTALNNLNESAVKKKAEEGDKKYEQLLKLLNRYDNYETALQLSLILSYVIIGMTWKVTLVRYIDGISANYYVTIGYSILLTLILLPIMVLAGVIIPQKYSLRRTEAVAYHLSGMILALGLILRPLTWFMKKLLTLLLGIVGLKLSDLEDNVTEEEIISMVNEGHEQGVFDADEVEMISNIIELDEKEAQDIMTHKKKIIAVNADMTIEKALQFMLSEKYTRYPLYEGNRDNIIGILHLKDVITAYLTKDSRNQSIKDIAREAYFVPDTQNINILFHEMQSKNIHMAIVIDEYGQTAGLVAMEDFIEEIVGNIQDEYDQDENMIIAREDDAVIVRGIISLEELEEEANVYIDHEDFDTLNGLLISLLDRIPEDGEKAVLTYEDYEFRILETKDKVIERVRISKLPMEQMEGFMEEEYEASITDVS